MVNSELAALLWQRDQTVYILTGVAFVLCGLLWLAGRSRFVRSVGGSLSVVIMLLVFVAGVLEPR